MEVRLSAPLIAMLTVVALPHTTGPCVAAMVLPIPLPVMPVARKIATQEWSVRN